jgi:putative GTP pyrophosphokinase
MLPPSELSKNQIDRLGDRLRQVDIGDDDLRLLDGYRRSFSDSYESVVGQIRDQLGLEPTGRPAKSTTSISEKLRRESIRLSQMQDIAGCRLTVTDMLTQDEVVMRLKGLFDRPIVVDRREHPSHGYRAVHVIVEHSGKLIEVQVRTSLQHLWAELSEKLSDVVDASVKYGGGDHDVVSVLTVMSKTIRDQELAEGRHLQVMMADDEDDDFYQEGLRTPDIMIGRLSIVKMLNAIGEVLPRMKGRKDDLPN